MQTFERGIIAPGDPAYDVRRATFNGMHDRRPLEIHVCSSIDDVVAAVRRASELNAAVSIRGGGHGVAGLCVGDGAVVIDLCGMRSVTVDAEQRVATAEGGANWEDYDTATLHHGLASTGGTFLDTGIAGLTLGGGIGYLMGTQGLTVDTLIGARLVTAAGEVLHASETENPDLFWAVRGAGTNFGAVVEFEYCLRPIGELYGGSIDYPLTAARDVLRTVRDLSLEAPDELVLVCVIGRTMGITTVLACFQGPAADGERLLRPLREAAPIVDDSLRTLSYAEMQATNPLLPFGLRHYWKGHFLRSLPDDLIEFSAEHIALRPASGFGTLLIEFINGAPTRVPAEAMAFNHREARVNASALGIWMSPEADADHIDWARNYAAGMTAHGNAGEYVNYMPERTGNERLRGMFGAEKFARLQQLKARFDPDNVFRFNQNLSSAAEHVVS